MMRASHQPKGSARLDPREVRTGKAARLPRVQIIDRQHPHFEEYGRFTGKIVTMKFGTREDMAEVALENCRHGVDGCFVRKGEVRQVAER
jgi:regulator of RNase E activity RraA